MSRPSWTTLAPIVAIVALVPAWFAHPEGIVLGALEHHLAVFNPEGTGAALATVIALAVLCLVVPSVTTSEPGPEFTGAQLAFAAIASLAFYGSFVFTQTIRHRDFFLPVAAGSIPVSRHLASRRRSSVS